MKLFQTIQKRSSVWSAPLQTKPASNSPTTCTQSLATHGVGLCCLGTVNLINR